MEMVSERIANLVTRLEPERSVDGALEQLLENELVRRLSRYQFTDRALTRKYEMSFADFKANRIMEQRGHSFEVESDFWDWEMALDGIETAQTMLTELRASRRVAQ